MVHRDVATSTAVVIVVGEMDALNCGHVESVLRSLLAEDILHILVDAGGVRFCDINAMRMLSRVHRELRGVGGEIVITAPEAVHKLAELMWPGSSPDRPAVFRSQDRREPEAAPVPPPPRRHVPSLRNLRQSSRSRRERVPVASPRDSHQILERAARLKSELEAAREKMLAQARTTCAGLAEVHERLAALHATLGERPERTVTSALLCDDHSHHETADRMRDRITAFTGRSG
ncbi:STAS domain-containing protein [Planobispora takensis]|uniref:STAS domain-containing protein n=1 Tax=Planobispora takensis TaxID=1367882 RepID=UPI00366A7440